MLQQLTLPKNYRLNEDGDLEKYCLRCQDWWPADTDFFHADKVVKGGLCSWCKACVAQYRVIKKFGNATGHGKGFIDPFADLLFGYHDKDLPALWCQASIKFIRS